MPAFTGPGPQEPAAMHRLDLDQNCDIVNRNPDRCTGPMRLRSAVRAVVQHRPLAQEVELRLGDGETLSEVEIEAIYAAASLPGPGSKFPEPSPDP